MQVIMCRRFGTVDWGTSPQQAHTHIQRTLGRSHTLTLEHTFKTDGTNALRYGSLNEHQNNHVVTLVICVSTWLTHPSAQFKMWVDFFLLSVNSGQKLKTDSVSNLIRTKLAKVYHKKKKLHYKNESKKIVRFLKSTVFFPLVPA